MGRGIRFTTEFKREAVSQALSSGRPRTEIAEDLGVGLSSLTRWIGQYRDEEMPPEIKDDLQAELKRLRKENRGKPPASAQVAFLRTRRELAGVHVLHHALAQRIRPCRCTSRIGFHGMSKLMMWRHCWRFTPSASTSVQIRRS